MPSKSPKLKLNVNNADRMRQYRKKWNEEQKQSNREKSRLRMREYRKRKKEEQLICAREKNVKTRQEVKKDEERKRKQAEYRRTYRQNLSGQKKRRIREKDALRKKLKRAEQKKTEKVRKGKEDPRPNYFQSNQSQSDTPIKPHEYTPSAVGKAVYRARKKLPKSPRKFAAVMKGLLQKVSPRKKAALKENGTLDNGSGDNLICEVLKEADASLKGKTKQERIQRKLFLRPIVKNIKKKYTIRKLSEKLGIRRRYLSSGCLKEERTRKDKLDKRTEERVSSFFQKEDISISLPNRKLVTKDGNERRILSGTLKETYDEWKEENPDMKLSLDKFIKLKPKSVKTQNNRKLLQCLCEYCENVTLKIRELNKFAEKCKKQDSKLKNIQDALDRTLCNKTGKFHALSCIDRNCSHCGTTKLKDDLKSNLPEADLTWKKWSMKASINTKTGKEIKKKQLTTQSGKTADLVDELINELDFLSKHLFEAHWQISQFAELKSNLPTNAVAVVADFAENYLCQSQNEIQAAHWAKDSITIHPTIVFYRCEDCSCIIEEACDVISNDLVHDSHAVFVFLEKIFQFLKEKRGLKIERVFLMTDGCAAQYKSRYPFADAANAVNDFNFVLQRDYYGSRHGKSRCDGEGGVLKSRVTRAVRNKEAVIGDAESFFKFCQEKMQKQQASNEKCEHKRRHMFYVDTTEVRRPRPERNIQTVNGTQKIHSLMGVSPTLIKTRRLSCFCDGCLEERSNNREYVDTWKTVHLKYVQSGQCKEIVADNTDTPVSDENGLDKNDGISHSLESTITDTDKMSRGGYFRKLLVSLLGCTSIKDLSVICESEDIFLKDMFPLHIKHEQRTILSVKKEIDQMAFDLMPADIQYDHPIFPVKVFGDGNCLPRTGSLFAFGDEESHEEIRARIVVQSVKYAEKYLDSTILSAGTEEEHCLPKIYAQYSDFYIPGISLTDDIVRKVFENEILAICKRGSFMGIWQLHALADVLQCTIHSVHPQYGGYNTRKHLNRTILPSCEGNRGMDLHIMWSNVNGKDTKEVLWAPNHFVPLLPVDKIPSALEVETADEGDDSTLNSFSFTSNFSFDESIFNLVVDDEDAAPLVNWKEDNVVTPVAVDKAVPLTPSLDRRENDVTEIGAPTVVDLDLPLAPRSKQKKDNLTVVGVPDVDMGVAFVPRGDKKKNDLSVISAPTDVETDVHVDQKNLAVVGTPQDVKMVVPLAPCGDQKKHDLPVSGIPTNIDIDVPAVSSRDQTKDELLVVCPPDEPSTISQRVFEKGQYLKVHFGTKSLPAIVDEWPWVKFFKKGNNKWVMNDIKYTIEADEVEKAIKAPQQIGRGRRTYFMFTDMDVPVEPLCDGRKDDLPVATTDLNMDIPVEPLCDGKKDDLPVAATDVNMDIPVEPLCDGRKDDLPVATTDLNMDIPVEPLCDGKKDDLPVAATDVNMDIPVEPLCDGKKDDLPVATTDLNMDIPVEPLCDGKKDDLPVAATDVNMDIPVEPLCDGRKDDLPVAATDVNMDVPVEPLSDGKKDDLPVAATDVNMDIPVEPLCDGKKDDLPVAATDVNMDIPVEPLCDGRKDDLPVATTDLNMDIPVEPLCDGKKDDLPVDTTDLNMDIPVEPLCDGKKDDLPVAATDVNMDIPVEPLCDGKNDDLPVAATDVNMDIPVEPLCDGKNDDLPVATTDVNMDIPVEPLCDGKKDDLPVATTDVNMDIPVEPLCDGKNDDLPVAATDVNMDVPVEPLSDGKKDDLPVAATDVNMDVPVEPLCDGKNDDLPVAATDVNMDIPVEPLCDGKNDDLPVAAIDVNMDVPMEPLCDGKNDDLPVAATDVNMDVPVEPLSDGKKDDLPVAATDVNMDIPVEPLCDGKKDDLPVAATDVNMDIPVEPLCDGKKDDLPVAATDVNMDVPVELLCDGKVDDLPVAATDVNMDVPAASSADQKKYYLPQVGVPTDVDVMDASVSHSIDVPVSPCKDKMNDDLAVVGAPPNVEIDVPFGPSSDQKNDDLPVAVLKTDQKIDKLPVVCPPGVSSCPPDEPSTAPQRAFEKGQYIKVHFGSKSLPAIVDEWPWVNFFKKDNNKWVMNDIKYTIEADEVEKVIKAPQQIGRGRRTYFKFAEMDC